MIELIDLGLGFLQQYLGAIQNKVPTEVVQSVQKAIDALNAHKGDVITQVNIDAQRGA